MVLEDEYTFNVKWILDKLVPLIGYTYPLGYLLYAMGFIAAAILAGSRVEGLSDQLILGFSFFIFVYTILMILFILRGIKIVKILIKGRNISSKALIVQGILLGAASFVWGVFYLITLKSIEDMISELGIFSEVAKAIYGGFLDYTPAMVLIVGGILLVLGVALLNIPRSKTKILGSILLLISVTAVYFIGIRNDPLCKLIATLCRFPPLAGVACIPCSGLFLSEVSLEGISSLLLVSAAIMYVIFGRRVTLVSKVVLWGSAMTFGIGLAYFGFSAGTAVLNILNLSNNLAALTETSFQPTNTYVLTIPAVGLFITGISGILILIASLVSTIPIAESLIPGKKPGKTREDIAEELIDIEGLNKQIREIEELLDRN